MSYAPIALFVYNRPDHTRQTVEGLLENTLARESNLYIFSDGAKRPEAEAMVNQVRAYVSTISGFRTVHVLEQEHNKGLANSIIAGVTSLCDQYGKVIVIEDDLIVSPKFLTYMNEALDRYLDESQVMQISGHMFPVSISCNSDAFFLPFTTSWGWATWARAWAKFDPEAKGYEQLLKDNKLRKKFDLDGSYPYWRMLQSQLQGKVDSWAIRWYLSVFQCRGLTLYPAQTMVNNIGFDGSGVHCGASVVAQMGLNIVGVSGWPDQVAVDEKKKKAVFKYLRNQNRNFFRRILRGVLGRVRATMRSV